MTIEDKKEAKKLRMLRVLNKIVNIHLHSIVKHRDDDVLVKLNIDE